MNEVYRIQYDDSFAELPSTAPRNHPHILDLSTYREHDGIVSTDIQLQDAIATVLHKISDTTLSDFLDFTKAFRIVFENKSEPRGNRVFIMRKDNEVLIAQYAMPIEPPVIEMDTFVRFSIDSTGGWKINYSGYRDYFPRDWEEVWAKRKIDIGQSAFAFETTDDEKMRMTQTKKLADYVLLGKYWDSDLWTWLITSG